MSLAALLLIIGPMSVLADHGSSIINSSIAPKSISKKLLTMSSCMYSILSAEQRCPAD